MERIPNNSLFITDAVPIRVVNLLSKHFPQPCSHLLTTNDPIVPEPCIRISEDKFEIFVDWLMITETTDAATAVVLLVAMYSIFEIKFSKNNRTARLLYGLLLRDTNELGKGLRVLLHSWEFPLDDQYSDCQIPIFPAYNNQDLSSAEQPISIAATTTEAYLNTTNHDVHRSVLSSSISDNVHRHDSSPIPIIHGDINDIDQPPMVIAMEVVVQNDKSIKDNEENDCKRRRQSPVEKQPQGHQRETNVVNNLFPRNRANDDSYLVLLLLDDQDLEYNIMRSKIRVILLHEFRLGHKATEAANKICSTMRFGVLSTRTAQHWFDRFRNGNYELDDQPRCRRPIEVDLGLLKQQIEQDPRLTTRYLAELLGCSHATVEKHLADLGKSWKYGVRIPHELSPYQLQSRVETRMDLLTSHRNHQ
ncbi:unnamed protein product [Didymodactylos carnosus]|uniref:Mos1 transposase HTH domain-containing protein n=1 Tax=Didymodactylos carnosus TaxID=1234261 RepID=A0A815AJR1_9BILA|nr:unnamed protein product [Didymodactylos carnosus]CAF4027712.1 unnamed protein product [Didymodactylos carnosus]